MSDQTPDDAGHAALLDAIQSRLNAGERRPLRPEDAVKLLDWAVSCPDAECQTHLLNLFRLLGGLDMVRAALSDYSEI